MHCVLHAGQGQMLGAEWPAVSAGGQGAARTAAHIQVGCSSMLEQQRSKFIEIGY